jgi:methionyl-tRNA formyltransferase
MVKICFISCTYLGYSALQALVESAKLYPPSIDISLISMNAVKGKNIVGYFDFSKFAFQNRLRFEAIESIKDPSVDNLIYEMNPDYILVIGWSELLRPSTLDIPMKLKSSPNRHGPGHGCIGMHPTLLPEGRGRAPIPWTIINGLRKSGVSVFLLENTADAGGIILQDKFQVEATETATTLYDKCSRYHYKLAFKLAPMLATHALSWKEQDGNKASYWPKRKPADGFINFNSDAIDIDRQIRALTPPYPGAFFYYQGNKIIIDKAEIEIRDVNTDRSRLGTILGKSSNGLPLIEITAGILKCLLIRPEIPNLNFVIGECAIGASNDTIQGNS